MKTVYQITGIPKTYTANWLRRDLKKQEKELERRGYRIETNDLPDGGIRYRYIRPRKNRKKSPKIIPLRVVKPQPKKRVIFRITYSPGAQLPTNHKKIAVEA